MSQKNLPVTIWDETSDNSVGLLSSTKVSLLAPCLRLHPDEEYFPMHPLDFIASSRLRHHIGGGSDKGFNKDTKKWDSNDKHFARYYDIPLPLIDKWGPHDNGKNRRPKDDNCGDRWNLFLQTRNRITGITNPSGVVPIFYNQWIGTDDTNRVSFWYFFGFSDAFGTFNHQGDWEHVTLKLNRGRLTEVTCYAHGDSQSTTRNLLFGDDNRLVLYIAKGTHATYKSTGSFSIVAIITDDETANGGSEWVTYNCIRRLDYCDWKDFAGAWGEVGVTGDTTGPLGPWHKREGGQYVANRNTLETHSSVEPCPYFHLLKHRNKRFFDRKPDNYHWCDYCFPDLADK